ncbi:hypothetical protein Pan216_16280 [Planctomycetes bacterium Pan216]|uniref:DUF1353 domain-containing protein n=1 Tax=Kolteria novifilia TaxID=2527975 RepID=A0A518B1H3_9BACT|nr:hypothetical protein Pan216_16280 [Planctomycetes bacterium Pan216]
MKMARLVILMIALVGIGYVAGWLFPPFAIDEDRPYGYYVGDVTTEWNSGGRDMTLQQDFTYVDASERVWLAPSGSVVNGASIPREFWSVIGSPFAGEYRDASVIHDVACVDKIRPHDDVHRMFHDACRCSGVSPQKAKVLYAAVAVFGPKWSYQQQPRERIVNRTVFSVEKRHKTVVDPDTGKETVVPIEVRVPRTVQEMIVEETDVPVPFPHPGPTEQEVAELVERITNDNLTLAQIDELANVRAEELYFKPRLDPISPPEQAIENPPADPPPRPPSPE